jgi:CheY-like chemotaxis protein
MIACLYHPTKVGLVDDIPEFLNILHNGLSKKNYKFCLSEDPIATVEDIKKSEIINPLEVAMTQCGDMTFEEECCTFSYDKVKDLIDKPERFDTYSVIVSDYSMPSANGLDLFKCIRKHPAKRVLLTSVADEQIAIDAFNEGLIHRYIRKDDRDFIGKVSEAIDELSKEFFASALEDVLLASGNAGSLQVPLNCSGFESYLQNIIQAHDIVEYYLLDRMGNYVLADKEGRLYTLYVQDDARLNEFKEEVLETEWIDEDAQLKKDILAGNKMFCCCGGSESVQKRPESWKEHYSECTKIIGEEKTYYCCLQKGYKAQDYLPKNLSYEGATQTTPPGQ